MLSLFKRKKIQSDIIAAQFAEHFLQAVDEGFPVVTALINDCPEFVSKPHLDSSDSDRFLLITLAANISSIQEQFPPHADQEMVRTVVQHVAELCDTDKDALTISIEKYQKFISKVNHPSKNLIYGMSKAVFYKYELAQFQEEYFKNVNSPNPIFLKRLDEAMVHFLWDWQEEIGN